MSSGSTTWRTDSPSTPAYHLRTGPVGDQGSAQTLSSSVTVKWRYSCSTSSHEIRTTRRTLTSNLNDTPSHFATPLATYPSLNSAGVKLDTVLKRAQTR